MAIHMNPLASNEGPLAREAQAAAEVLAKDFDAEEIWLFGSCATGTTDDDSDIDLLVVRPPRPDSARPGVEARLCLSRRGIAHPFDLLVITPERWQAERAHPFGVFEEIVHHGIKLYER